MQTVVKILNEALEIAGVLRYRNYRYMASDIHSQAVAAEVPRSRH